LQSSLNRIIVIDLRGGFKVDQDHTTFVDHDVSMVAVLTQQPKLMEPFQHMLALLEVSRLGSFGSPNLLQDKSDRSAILGDIGQELGPDALALNKFVDVALFLDIWDLVVEPSDFDDDGTAKHTRRRVTICRETTIAVLALV
jgi:hypothetical protein